MLSLLASIPSPSSSTIEIGPLRLTAYGLMIAIGAILGLELARRRWAARGGDPDDIGAIAIWAVPAGLIGARLYHVATDWNRLYADSPGDFWKIHEGGLGIPGGILLGTLVGAVVAQKRGMRLPVGLDVVAPSLILAQAIGRLGNWWNQELYGRPTDLPWGLEIDPVNRQDGYGAFETFHPTFLYEMLWNLGLMLFMLWLDKKRIVRPGRIFAVYVMGYGLGRLWIEMLRIDTATQIAGLRVNEWMSMVLIVGAGLVIFLGGPKRRPDDSDEPYADGHRFVPPAAESDASAAVKVPAANSGVDEAERLASEPSDDAEVTDST